MAEGLPRTAEEMGSISIIRSLVSAEGDHERATYAMKTGQNPDPTVIHPSIGAILCHQLPEAGTEIPRHISILSGQWPARGGFLGDRFDAFRTNDPSSPLPDMVSLQPVPRDERRLRDLDVIEQAFAQRRQGRTESTGHRDTINAARRMMNSEQLRAFEINQESASLRQSYGNTPFGRACLAARRLTEVGVRCVEVTLSNFDSHVNNHEIHRGLLEIFDPAFSTLIRDFTPTGQLESHHCFGRHRIWKNPSGQWGWRTRSLAERF